MRAIYCRYSPVLKEFTSRHLPPRFSALGATYKEQEVKTTRACCRLRRLTSKPGIPTANRAAGGVFGRFQPSLACHVRRQVARGSDRSARFGGSKRLSSCTYRELRPPGGSMQIIRG